MVKVKRYLVFATLGDALGGWNDFKGSFGSKREAIKVANNLVDPEAEDWQRQEWYLHESSHVIDTQRGAGAGIVVHEAMAKPRIVYNQLIGAWYVVRGSLQFPLSGPYASRKEAQEWFALQE
jgi:hypothetical protein